MTTRRKPTLTREEKLERSLTDLANRRQPIDLDVLLTPAECAAWLKISEDTLDMNVRRKRIPVVRLNERLFRFHPRSIIAAKIK